jgi:hypothetical protein
MFYFEWYGFKLFKNKNRFWNGALSKDKVILFFFDIEWLHFLLFLFVRLNPSFVKTKGLTNYWPFNKNTFDVVINFIPNYLIKMIYIV